MGALAGGIIGGGAAGVGGAAGGAAAGDQMQYGSNSNLVKNTANNKLINPIGNANLGPSGGKPVLADIQQGTTANDVRGAQAGVDQGLASQQNLLAALQGQNGLGMQSSLANQMSGSNGIGAQNTALQGLQGAAGMYGQIAQGQGPNPAQAMLNQQTGQNVANQAALMAGQRGAGANAGLLARQAAQQGAGIQQQAVGQGATMQANQQLNALQGMTGANQAIGGLGSQQVGQASGMANQMAGQQIGQVNANMQANLSNQQQMQNALGGINQANVANQASVNAGNVGLAQTAIGAKSGIFGGLMNSAGTALSSMGAKGGEVVSMAAGGPAYDNLGEATPPGGTAEYNSAPPAQETDSSQPESSFGKFLNATKGADPSQQEQKDLGEIASIVALAAAKGGLAESGGHVKAKGPGQKAVASGDSYSNDKIPAKLSEGEIVLPRSVTMSDDPVAAAGKFVADTLAKRKGVSKEHKGMFADKGLVESTDAPDESDDSADQESAPPPVSAQAQPTPQPVLQPEVPASPEAAAPEESSDDDAAEKEEPAEKEVAPQTSAPITPLHEEKDQLHAETAKTAKDLTTGHLHSRTLKDLFHDKGTMGKIGMIFGMMLSGAGSGLAHQQNGALELMNKQLDRDLDAQKESAHNAQNLLRINQANEKNKADVGLTGAQKKLADVDADIKANALTRTQMNLTALHDMVMAAQKLPPGSPQRVTADQQLGMIANAVDNENYNINDRAYAKSRLAHAMLGGGQQQASEANFQQEQRGLRVAGNDKLADDNESRHMPGVRGMASVPLSSQDRDNITGSQSLMGSLQRLKDFAKNNPHPTPGSKEDKEGKALAAMVQGDFRIATHGGVYKEGEQNFINQVVPGNPGTWSPFAHVSDKIDTVINETKARNDQFLKSKGFPVSGGGSKQGGQKNKQDLQAAAWAKANPKDPRAAKILKRLGGS